MGKVDINFSLLTNTRPLVSDICQNIVNCFQIVTLHPSQTGALDSVKNYYDETPVHGRFRFLPWWFWFILHLLVLGAIALKLVAMGFSAL